jgi:hypothetical protein
MKWLTEWDSEGPDTVWVNHIMNIFEKTIMENVRERDNLGDQITGWV